MKKFSKIMSLVLAVMMVMAVATAWADDETETSATAPASLTNGEVGGFSTADTPTVQSKSVILKKEITVYNVNESKVNAPTITYAYAIAAGTANVKVTDDTSDHATGVGAITAPTKTGIVTDTAPTITSSLAWTTSDELNASTDGTANTKDIVVNFSDVVFTGAGVYRYKITETPHSGVDSYAKTGVTEGNTNHVRFLDVYVKPANTFTNGSTAAEWEIYGYVCVDDGTNGNTAVTPSTTKTNGFVDSDSSTTVSTADKYYTYNLTISKTVENDNYAKANHQFPFSVIFTNSDVSGNILLKTTETGTVTDFTHNAGAPTWAGVAKIKDSGSIKYIGIPMGTDVEVYETNDVTGATYTVSTTKDSGTAVVDNAVIDGTTPSTGVAQTTKMNYQSTKATIDTTKDADDDTDHKIAINNKLLLISPTGYVTRFAPYALILIAGIALMVVAMKRRKTTDEE